MSTPQLRIWRPPSRKSWICQWCPVVDPGFSRGGANSPGGGGANIRFCPLRPPKSATDVCCIMITVDRGWPSMIFVDAPVVNVDRTCWAVVHNNCHVTIITTRLAKRAKVMFSQACVTHSVQLGEGLCDHVTYLICITWGGAMWPAFGVKGQGYICAGGTHSTGMHTCSF